jgi:hypothetical protein
MENIQRRRKSELLTKEEHKALLKYINTFHTLVDAAYAIGISRQVLERVKVIGSGSPENVQIIRGKLQSLNTPVESRA